MNNNKCYVIGMAGNKLGLRKSKRPLNKAEGAFWDEATKAGWVLTKKGWPDFICRKDGEVILVEVKAHRGRRLKREQLALMLLLSRLGMKCYRWSPDKGFERIMHGEASIYS